MRLSGDKAQKAWEDYKAFLEGMGSIINGNPVSKHIEQAFKLGFAQGMGEANKQPKEVIKQKPPSVTVQQSLFDTPKQARYRTAKQMRDDADFIKSLLKGNVGPMKLQDIIKAADAAGRGWHHKSVTGHMYKAMEIHPGIKRLGNGFYEYQQ